MSPGPLQRVNPALAAADDVVRFSVLHELTSTFPLTLK